MAQSLIIIGTGGNALDILDVVEAINHVKDTWRIKGFLDDSRAPGSQFEGGEILGGVRDATRHTDCLFVNAIGGDRSYRKRPDIVTQTKLNPSLFATIIHPLAVVSSRATLGYGVCINAGVVVGGRVTVASHVWLGAGGVIGSNAIIAEYAMISARVVLGGSAQVGSTAYIGAGACVRQRVTIGEKALIGLGSVVIADVPAGTTVVGNPARVLVRTSKQGKSSDTPQPRPGLVDPSAPSGAAPADNT
jgi:sugar O-acyltransferase (sialic acid O-acetyltransferase NeuD family)